MMEPILNIYICVCVRVWETYNVICNVEIRWNTPQSTCMNVNVYFTSRHLETIAVACAMHSSATLKKSNHTHIYIYIPYIYTWYLGTLETVEYCYKQLKRFNSVFYQKRINKQNKQLIGVRFLSFYMVNHLQMHISKCISTYYITKNMRKNYRIPISSAVSAGKWLLLPCCPMAPWGTLLCRSNAACSGSAVGRARKRGQRNQTSGEGSEGSCRP